MDRFQEILAIELFEIADTPVDVSTLAVAILTALTAWVVSRIAEKGTAKYLQRRGVHDEGSVGTSARLVHYLILGVGLAIAVDTLGIDLAALFAAGAVLAIAAGFAMQNIAQNFVAGLILLVERTIKPGDVLDVEGRVVRVTQLGMRATVTRTWDAEDYIIPNATLISNTVKNYTLRDKQHRLRCPVGVSYDSDMRQVAEVLERAAAGIEWRDTSLVPVVLLRQFGDSSVDWEVSIWTNDPFQRTRNISDLNKVIWFALKEAGITIAYPQLDLHLDQEDLRELRGSAG